MVATQRQTAEQRREAVLEAARVEFAEHGQHGASTDAIARGAGISQPYLFRLFGSKKELYLATVAACFDRTLETFRAAAAGTSGQASLKAIADAYLSLIDGDPTMLRAQLQAYAACEDADVRAVVQRGYGRLVDYVEAVSGASPDEIAAFFSKGMLINVLVAMQLHDCDEPWATCLLAGMGERRR